MGWYCKYHLEEIPKHIMMQDAEKDERRNLGNKRVTDLVLDLAVKYMKSRGSY